MKEDLTIWHIHGLELPLDIEEADTKPIPKEIYLMNYSVYKYLTIQV